MAHNISQLNSVTIQWKDINGAPILFCPSSYGTETKRRNAKTNYKYSEL